MQTKWKIPQIIAAILLLSFIAFKNAPDSNKAEVNQVQGFFIFTDSKPVAQYTYLGTVTLKRSGWNPQYTNNRDKMISIVKNTYPESDAIIFHFNSGGADKADAIKMQP